MKGKNINNKFKPLIVFLFTLCLFILQIRAQEVSVRIKITSENRVSVEGSFKDESVSQNNWSFLQDYADASNLAERIYDFQVFDKKGEKLEIKKLNSGEYLAEIKPSTFKYQVDLTPSKKITDSAHASWLTQNQGILMLADILPHLKSESVYIDFDLPQDFKITHSYPLLENFDSKDFELSDAVLIVGRNWREREISFSENNQKKKVKLAIAGEWQFSDEEILEMTKSIFEEYRNIFGEIPNSISQIILSPFPQENTNSDRWRAETRGSTVTIISGVLPYKTQALQRLHEQLRHEIFHLWMPNSLSLSGNFDWFYEGFTIYQALRTGVLLNQIRFEDYLNTLAKAYDLSEGQTSSLIEASNKRWLGAGNFVYAKGLVVAFLCDAAILQTSKGKRSLKDVFREIYRKHKKSNQIQDGNSAIISILRSFPELNPIIMNYLEGKSKINWENDLSLVGIGAVKSDFGIELKVLDKLNGRQKDLLDKLGYNQWRKNSQKIR